MKNSEQQPQTAEKKEEIKTSSQNQSKGGIRCYGKTGFFYPEKQPDGTVIQRFCYGREGD